MLMNFSWIREGELAGMGMPGPDAWTFLRAEGVRAVLTLTERPPLGDPAGAGLAYLHVPLIDFGTPSLENLQRCVTWIAEQTAAERPVVVHCFAGQGRTGTVLAAFLVSVGLTPEEAIAEVRRLRPHSIETRGQEDAIRRFAEG
ncbi:MAG: dual specificity protein phosphatase family protein [Planctomycetota bacterium]|nr:dual specificity protein phosphatase family protein [Planctomycetota bacterium]